MDAVMRKIRVRNISMASIIITVVLSALCIVLFMYGHAQFEVLQSATKTYTVCKESTEELQSGSDYLTEQVRLAAITGEIKYIDAYFNEANALKHREDALDKLREQFDGTEAMDNMQKALDASNSLMDTELYAMRLVCEAQGLSAVGLRSELSSVSLSAEDAAKSREDKLALARDLVSNDEYQDARTAISADIENCVEALDVHITNQQGHAASVFEDVYRKLEISIVVFAIMTLGLALFSKKAVIDPLVRYSKSVKEGAEFPVVGAAELQTLAETYNRVYEENEATQKLVRHQAEHDALTDLLNRGSYDRILKLYEEGTDPFALILVDVDTFKQVNDTYGHAAGDKVLKRVALLLQTAFRSIDHVCRIGGDEFAVVMVDVTTDLSYTISEKIAYMNQQLAKPAEEGMPAVSLSVGVAFSDRANPGDSIFKDADAALYHVKENGRCGCCFYGQNN